MSREYTFDEVGRLPLPGDNVAIATRRLEAGAVIRDGDRRFALDYTVMEGHRFAVRTIPPGAPVLSWELPFGYALTEIRPGSYLVNQGMLEALAQRTIDFDLPPAPNFRDQIDPYQLDRAHFTPAAPTERYPAPGVFLGYRRPGDRGVGTRNMILLLGVTSRANGFVRRLEAKLKARLGDLPPNVDGIAAVTHTEGADGDANNMPLVLRTLAGFMVHPNTAAVLAVDYGTEPITNRRLTEFMVEHDYPIDHVLHDFFTIREGFDAALDRAADQVMEWLPTLGAQSRAPEPLSALKIALQCGGSDAFSGVSGNPLASWAAREVIRHGGSANLAETDELIGAESYVLQKVADLETAERFLATVERFKAWAGTHGESAEGNPSGGNKYRGLYNITLKSIGAAMKRHPDVRLDAVIDYAQPMTAPGFYFMDSPGNDLESIAGQVASGCNLIYFITGNGSITNFPFVPTIKLVTTTDRYRLLQHDMDVNAGAYLDGVAMDELGADLFTRTCRVAEGERSVGERAGHAQVQLWRNWRQTGATDPATVRQVGYLPGRPLILHEPDRNLGESRAADRTFPAVVTPSGATAQQIGLILPTSLCAGQIAQMAAQRFNQARLGRIQGVERFAALVHTEGCGSGRAAKDLHAQTMLGYLQHPAVAACLLLEHGCEITHNDYMHHALAAQGLDPANFGWASIQLDGGIDAVVRKIERWFVERLAGMAPAVRQPMPLTATRLGIYAPPALSDDAAAALADLSMLLARSGGTVVLAGNGGLVQAPALARQVTQIAPTVAYAQPAATPGLHIMEAPTGNAVETLVGLGGTGVDLIIAYVDNAPVAGHPLLPVLQVTMEETLAASLVSDVDLILDGATDSWPDRLAMLTADALAGVVEPVNARQGNVDFQVTRGQLGISL